MLIMVFVIYIFFLDLLKYNRKKTNNYILHKTIKIVDFTT